MRNLFKYVMYHIYGVDNSTPIVTRDYKGIDSDEEIRRKLKWNELFQYNISEVEYDGWSSPSQDEMENDYYHCLQLKNGRHIPVPLARKWGIEVDKYYPPLFEG